MNIQYSHQAHNDPQISIARHHHAHNDPQISLFRYYKSVVQQQETNLHPNQYVGHPYHFNPYAGGLEHEETAEPSPSASSAGLSGLAWGLRGSQSQTLPQSPRASKTSPAFTSPGRSSASSVSASSTGSLDTTNSISIPASPPSADRMKDRDYISGRTSKARHKQHMNNKSSGNSSRCFAKRLPSRSTSLYLDGGIRAATLLGITDTKRVTFQGST